MNVADVTDRKSFLSKAAQAKEPIRVVRFPTVVPTRQGRTIKMVPALSLHYLVRVGDTEWVYRETIVADSGGRATLDGTLMRELEASQETHPYEILHRSGSI